MFTPRWWKVRWHSVACEIHSISMFSQTAKEGDYVKMLKRWRWLHVLLFSLIWTIVMHFLVFSLSIKPGWSKVSTGGTKTWEWSLFFHSFDSDRWRLFHSDKLLTKLGFFWYLFCAFITFHVCLMSFIFSKTCDFISGTVYLTLWIFWCRSIVIWKQFCELSFFLWCTLSVKSAA